MKDLIISGFQLTWAVKQFPPLQGGDLKGRFLETIVVVLIVCLAAGYLVRRYLKKGKNAGGCACENMECTLKDSDSGPTKHSCHEMICEGKKCNADPLE